MSGGWRARLAADPIGWISGLSTAVLAGGSLLALGTGLRGGQPSAPLVVVGMVCVAVGVISLHRTARVTARIVREQTQEHRR